MDLTLGYQHDGRVITSAGAENPHIFIGGISGSGKSFALKRLAEQAAAQGALVIVFDYTADWGSYQAPEGISLRRLDVMDRALQINPLAPVPGATGFMRAQRLLNLLLSAYRLGNRACIDLTNSTRLYLDECTENPTIPGLINYILAHPATKGLDAALEPLKALSLLINSGPASISLDLDTPGILVLDFTQLESTQLRKLLIEVFLRAIWDAKASSKSECPLVLLLDECQNLNWGKDSMSVLILREGRKFGIGGWFATQWISNENAVNALQQAAVQLHFRQNKENTLPLARTLSNNVPVRRDKYARLLCSFKPGDFMTRDTSGHVRLGHVQNE